MSSNKVYLFSTSSHPDAISINSLEFQYFKPEIDFSIYDYFIITSKQTSNALKQYKSELLKPALCISQATANAYKKMGGEVLEVGSGYGDKLTHTIKKFPKETKWLYLRAKEIASNFAQSSKNNGFSIDEIIMYESSCSKDILEAKIENDATLIFTSPSSIKCFLKNKNIEQTNKVIVIGKTTASSLPSGVQYSIAKENTIKSCLELK